MYSFVISILLDNFSSWNVVFDERERHVPFDSVLFEFFQHCRKFPYVMVA